MIHYHGTPCGGKRTDVEEFLAGRHALIPWVRNEDIGCAAEVCQSFMLDNSAFSAWRSGEPIKDWGGYYEWVQEWCRHPGFDFAVIPDVIDGDEMANDKLLAEWYRKVPNWIPAAPVWHMHERITRLEALASCHKGRTVCLGSSGEYATVGTQQWWERMNYAMNAICDEQGRPMCRLHGLRMLDPAVFHRLPLASADSTNAVRNGNSVKRFGMYCPPTNGQRQATIARRIEQHQSAAVWVPLATQGTLCFVKDFSY